MNEKATEVASERKRRVNEKATWRRVNEKATEAASETKATEAASERRSEREKGSLVGERGMSMQ